MAEHTINRLTKAVRKKLSLIRTALWIWKVWQSISQMSKFRFLDFCLQRDVAVTKKAKLNCKGSAASGQ